MKRLSNITESIWSDIQDRSSGETVRKEDDVDLMDIDSFCEYMKSRYECDMTKTKSGFDVTKTNRGNFMNIPLFTSPFKGKYVSYDVSSFTYYTDEKCLAYSCTSPKYDRLYTALLDEKCKDFNNITFDRRGYIRGDITNSMVVELTDFILDTIKKPLTATIRRK